MRSDPMQQSTSAARAAGGWRRGNPAGNPGLNLAPRCGARARSGEPCRAPAMANGRCRMHGGGSTGPRTPEGMARMIAARTSHGRCSAAARADELWRRMVRVRFRLLCVATELLAYLPPGFAARLRLVPEELCTPVHPSNQAFVAQWNATPCNCLPGGGGTGGSGPVGLGSGPAVSGPVAASGAGEAEPGRRAGRAARAAGAAPSGRAAERLAALVEADLLAPWRQAIAVARAAKRAARAAKCAARDAARAARDAARAARDAERTVRDAARAVEDATRAAPAGSAKRGGGMRGAIGDAAVVRHDPMQLSAALESDRAGARRDGVDTSPAVGFAAAADASSDPWTALRPRPAGAGEPSLLQRELAARAAGLRRPGNGPRQAEAASRLRPDTALPGINPMQLSAASGPVMPEAGPGRVFPTGACHRARPGGESDPPIDPARRRPGCGAARPGEGPFRRGLLRSTACNEPTAHKVAALVGLPGGWMGRVTLRATRHSEPDHQAWLAEAGRKRAAQQAERLPARCIIQMESVADIVRWDDLSGDGG